MKKLGILLVIIALIHGFASNTWAAEAAPAFKEVIMTNNLENVTVSVTIAYINDLSHSHKNGAVITILQPGTSAAKQVPISPLAVYILNFVEPDLIKEVNVARATAYIHTMGWDTMNHPKKIVLDRVGDPMPAGFSELSSIPHTRPGLPGMSVRVRYL